MCVKIIISILLKFYFCMGGGCWCDVCKCVEKFKSIPSKISLNNMFGYRKGLI